MLDSKLVEIRNFTGQLERGEAFVRAKAAQIETHELSIHIKFTRARGRDINGYYRWDDRRMVLAVKKRLRYPRMAAYGVGTMPRKTPRRGGLPYRLVWHEDRFESPDDLLVFVAGHEFWHFLCHTGQRKRDHETKANCLGFSWLLEFRAWAGLGVAVDRIPAIPPRPDLPAMSVVERRKDSIAGDQDLPEGIAAFTPSGILEKARQLLLFRQDSR
ncbi:MAG TPA: hypothetical protein VGK20_04470 [Candidatus Binatia bacterium]|jgi:hypothetical protein